MRAAPPHHTGYTPTSVDARQTLLETLFNTYARGVGSYVYTRVRDAELAETITSRVFLIVVRNIGQLKGPPAPWIWSIVRSELARHFRDRKVHAPVDETIPADPAGEPPEQAIHREMQARVQTALTRLTDDQQRLVFMKFYQGMQNKEIATATGLTATNVGVLIHRALKQLKTYVEPREMTKDETRMTNQ